MPRDRQPTEATTMPTPASPLTRPCQWRRSPSARQVVSALALALVAACGEDNLIPQAVQDKADLYWDLELNHHAIALSTSAPYDTIQLVATPVNFENAALNGLPAAQYRSTDPERVAVDAEGLVIGVAATAQPVAIIATLTSGNLKHVDTALVSVVDVPAPPVLASLSIRPLPPDSAKTSTNTSILVQPGDTLPARATTAEGERIPVYGLDGAGYLPVYFSSSDTTVGRVGDEDRSNILRQAFPEVHGVRPGEVTFYAVTTAFGVTKADTLPYRIGWPVFGKSVVLVPFNGFGQSRTSFAFDNPEVVIGAGGLVAWSADKWIPFPPNPADTVDITFTGDNAANVMAPRLMYDFVLAFNPGMANFYFCRFDCDGSGNVYISGETPTVARYFPVPGTYEYHSVRKGLSGRVIVVGDE